MTGLDFNQLLKKEDNYTNQEVKFIMGLVKPWMKKTEEYIKANEKYDELFDISTSDRFSKYLDKNKIISLLKENHYDSNDYLDLLSFSKLQKIVLPDVLEQVRELSVFNKVKTKKLKK